MAERTGVVTATRLNVRPEPSTQSPPLGKLDRGAMVEILDVRGGWYRVRAGDLEGFVHGDFVRLRGQGAAPGFLCDRSDLRLAPLQPPTAEMIAVGPRLTRAERNAADTWNRYGGLLGSVGEIVGVPPSAAVAVLCVESNGHGFVDGRMTIRFESHVFFDQWGKHNDGPFASLFRFSPQRRWTGHQCKLRPDGDFEPFHGDQRKEWSAFELARGLNESAALRSISMGAPQIMGFNFAAVGYDSVQEMFERFSSDVRYQILGMFDFIRGPAATSRMLQALQRGQWEQFATFYNGPGQAAAYGTQIRNHAEAFRRLRPEH